MTSIFSSNTHQIAILDLSRWKAMRGPWFGAVTLILMSSVRIGLIWLKIFGCKYSTTIIPLSSSTIGSHESHPLFTSQLDQPLWIADLIPFGRSYMIFSVIKALISLYPFYSDVTPSVMSPFSTFSVSNYRMEQILLDSAGSTFFFRIFSTSTTFSLHNDIYQILPTPWLKVNVWI